MKKKSEMYEKAVISERDKNSILENHIFPKSCAEKKQFMVLGKILIQNEFQWFNSNISKRHRTSRKDCVMTKTPC